ncbi:hypothetical protein [Foetidibacter luteolus]|uniref:hypothetical protein n=1 Tax=Foetidibacter luteolus TaxID=2608880 RepID=UPI00129B5D14|nr:hypothetical protein [Foetidibacter luteolus]
MNSTLPPFVIAELFRNTLVLTGDVKAGLTNDETQITTKKPEAAARPAPLINKKWWLGDNRRHITVVVSDEDNAYIDDNSLNTLMKLLEALKMNMADIAIVNASQQQVTFTLLKKHLQPQYVLLFGISTKDIQLPFAMPDYQVQKHGNCTILSAPVATLSTEKNDKAINAEKRKLWDSLKRVFS